MAIPYPRVARLNNAEKFSQRIEELGINLPFDEQMLSGEESPLAQPYQLPNGRVIGNRFCTLPMEGWDGTEEGNPTAETIRRWRHFGASGAKLIWGGEAVAVRHDGRANPNQLVINDGTLSGLEQLHRALLEQHEADHGTSEDLFIGLQLTHSGRFSRPNEKTRLEPTIVYHHPVVDKLFDLPEDYPVISDAQIEDLIADYVRAARQAQEIGFDFVDIKHCHGYLGHEFLSARSRPGPYGGSFENRTRFLREIVRGVQSECPGLVIGVRLSAFDFMPFRPGEDDVGTPLDWRDQDGKYPYTFGGDSQDPLSIEFQELYAFIELLQSLDVPLLNLTAASPYYNPHLTRPAFFPPSDGYQPPEDPLVGVARQINVVATLKRKFPEMGMVGSAYSYLQDWLPNVAQHVIANKMVDFVGLGRMILSYPQFPTDVLAGATLDRKRICRTFSDCTTAPRNGLISGCYPLDEFYKNKPEAETLKEIKNPKQPSETRRVKIARRKP